MVRVTVKRELLRWACDRSGKGRAALAGRFGKLEQWESGKAKPTLRQLEDFAKATNTPLGSFFLDEPPDEPVPIPDFRTRGGRAPGDPSRDLLDTIYLCLQRQEWYREFARSEGEEPRPFVGSAETGDDVERTAGSMRRMLGLDLEERRGLPTWIEALRRFVEQADALGVLVMVSGVVGSDNRRRLDPEEFGGFALADDLAPLVFVNGSDTKAAQMFTLAHELAHLWLGQSALSDVGLASAPSHGVESWCNRVAAELLVPLARVREQYDARAPLRSELDRLARQFKVSTLVVLSRLRDAGALPRDEFRGLYGEELARVRGFQRRSGGGDFYLTLGARAGRRFARALVASTLEGRTSFTEAFRLLGLRRMSSFQDLGRRLGMGM